MDKIQLLKTLQESPSIKLLRSRKVEFIISFITDVFENSTFVSSERIHLLLENRLDETELVVEEEEDERPGRIETNEDKAKRWIQEWTNKGFLTNYQNENGDVMYEMSAYSSKVLDWVENLKKEDYIGTESKFKSLFYQLKELVEFTNEDREKRLEMLKEKKMEIEHQIQQLEMGEHVKVFEEYEIVPRYHNLNRLAKELLSDFKEVDNNFKEIIRQIYQHQINNSQKKELLNYIFDAYSELKKSSQGKSFYAFWEFLLSPDLQLQWQSLINGLFDTLDDRQIDPQDSFLKYMQQYLFSAAEKVYKTNDRMSEKLSRIIRQNEMSNAEITKKVIDEIKKLLIDCCIRQQEKPEVSLEVEEINLCLPLERQLSLEPTPTVEYKEKPAQAQVDIEDLGRLAQLFSPYQVDRDALRTTINRMLSEKTQATLGEIIEKNRGITKGLAEIIGYISVLDEYHTVKNTEKTQIIPFTADGLKYIEIPEIIITR